MSYYPDTYCISGPRIGPTTSYSNRINHVSGGGGSALRTTAQPGASTIYVSPYNSDYASPYGSSVPHQQNLLWRPNNYSQSTIGYSTIPMAEQRAGYYYSNNPLSLPPQSTRAYTDRKILSYDELNLPPQSRVTNAAANNPMRKSRSQYNISYPDDIDDEDDDEPSYRENERHGRLADRYQTKLRRPAWLDENETNGSRYRTTSKPNGTITARSSSGLQNLGNTCFMNSILQCLANTSQLKDYILDKEYQLDVKPYSKNGQPKTCLISAFAKVIDAMWRSTYPIAPNNLRHEVGRISRAFLGYSQHDAQEFLTHLLQSLSEELNQATTAKKNTEVVVDDVEDTMSSSEKASKYWKTYLEGENSKIVDLFMGQLKSELKCGGCGYVSNTFDPILGLSVPIKKAFRIGDVTLMECLELFSQSEKLDGRESTTCSKCKKKQNAKKKLTIQRFPKILIIHLKRFSETSFGHSKLATKVKCPLYDLDLRRISASDRMAGKPVYDLYAMCNHYGSATNGHYTACAKNPSTGLWYLYDDDRVTAVSRPLDELEDAYILFYELTTKSTAL